MINKKNKIIKWFRKKYNLFLYHGKSYDIIWKLKFNRLSFVIILTISVLIFFSMSYVVIAYTSIKENIPDFPTEETKLMIYENAIKADSLLAEIEKRDLYLKMIQDLIYEDIPIDQQFVVPTQHLNEKQIREFNNPTLPRKKIEERLSNVVSSKEYIPNLFPPIKGIIVSVFNKSKAHYGTDIVSSGATTINAVLGGTVLISDYTVKDGYTVIIQHKFDLVSVYKHNKSIMVTVGQYVEIGQAIAVYGNSGENTSGEHLHFELWKKGIPLNPEDYIKFE